ncbi:MAG: hypothetical protein K6B72_01200 [Lachnospiraceae bacterium]|nr:hypothetical protein [Lachnospiraceae bacterium]
MNRQYSISETRVIRNRIRRQRQLRRRMLIAGYIMTATLFLMIFTLNGMLSDAHEADRPEIFKYYRSEIILPGDTVENAAEHFLTAGERGLIDDACEYCAEIRFINHLSAGEQPLAGTSLIIPYYSTEFNG